MTRGENDISSTESEEEDQHTQEPPMPAILPFGLRKPNRLQQIGGKPFPHPLPPKRKPQQPVTEAPEESTTEGCLFQTSEPDSAANTDSVTEGQTTLTPRPTKKRPPPTPPTSHSGEDEGVDLVYSISRMDEDGGYFFDFLASNSVFRQEQGFFKTDPNKEGEKIHVKTGAYGFTSPEGARVRVDYVADENGFRAFDTT